MSNSADRAFQWLKGRILDGQYDAGQRLPEDMIAADLGLSRTPVRDALRRLQAEGLVEITPNSGARVAQWTAQSLGELAHMRAMLEGYAAELAAQKATPEGCDRLDALVVEMAAIIERPPVDLDALSRNNLAFHREVATMAGNHRLLVSIETLWNFSLVVRKFALFGRSRLERSLSHHREIAAALREGDAEWAGSLMRAHIHAARALDAPLLDSRGEER